MRCCWNSKNLSARQQWLLDAELWSLVDVEQDNEAMDAELDDEHKTNRTAKSAHCFSGDPAKGRSQEGG